MDVQKEFEAAQRRLDAKTDQRVRAAMARIKEPTPTERAEIVLGLREDARVKAFESMGIELGKWARLISDMWGALGRGFKQGSEKSGAELSGVASN